MPGNPHPRRYSLTTHQHQFSTVRGEREDRSAEYISTVASFSHLAPAERPLNILAEGDSWFDYPLPVYNPVAVINALRMMASRTPNVLNLAHYGDEARGMLGVMQRTRLIATLKNGAFGKFDAILFSGGGNDIVGDQFCLWVRDRQSNDPASDAVDMPRLEAALKVIEGTYLDLIEIRDHLAPDAKLFIHSYDFGVPDGRGACTLGPWLKPSLDYRGWTDINDGMTIVKNVLTQFDAVTANVAANNKNVFHVKTQGTLSSMNDWANELHPTIEGFKKIAAIFLAELRHRFPGRI